MTIDDAPQFFIFDIEDELDEDFDTFHDIGIGSDYNSGSLFAHPVIIPPLRRDVYGLSADPTHLQSCESLVRAAMKKTAAVTYTEAPPPELSLVGATGTAFKHTKDLHVKRLKEALASPQRNLWMEAIYDEFDRFDKHGVFQVVPAAEMPMHYKALSSVWTQKANGIFRARLTMREYEKIPGLHYSPAWTSAPVTGAVTVRFSSSSF